MSHQSQASTALADAVGVIHMQARDIERLVAALRDARQAVSYWAGVEVERLPEGPDDLAAGLARIDTVLADFSDGPRTSPPG